MDSLLPGYALRPNRSPIKAVGRLPPPPPIAPRLLLGGLGSTPVTALQDGGKAEGPPPSKRARTLRDMAALRPGGVPAHEVERTQGMGLQGVAHAHRGEAERADGPQQGQQQQPQQPGEQPQAVGRQQGIGSHQHQQPPAHGLFAELQAELESAEAAAAAADADGTAGGGAVVHGGDMGGVQQQQQQGAAQQRRGERQDGSDIIAGTCSGGQAAARRSRGSRRKQSPAAQGAALPASTASAGAAAAAPAAAVPGEAGLQAAALHLPLAPVLQHLEWAFGVLAAVHSFLQAMHIQASDGCFFSV